MYIARHTIGALSRAAGSARLSFPVLLTRWLLLVYVLRKSWSKLIDFDWNPPTKQRHNAVRVA